MSKADWIQTGYGCLFVLVFNVLERFGLLHGALIVGMSIVLAHLIAEKEPPHDPSR